MMYSFGVLNTFAEEKTVFVRELQSKYYSLPAYFASKTLVELPFQILFPVLQGVAIYLPVFWDSFNWVRLGYFCVFTVLLANCGQAIGVFAAASFNSLQVGLAVLPIIFLPVMTFAGLFINESSVPVYWSWAPWVSPMRYAFNALMKNEYEGMVYYGTNGTVIYTGEQALDAFSLNDGLNIYWDMLILFGFYLVLICLSYFALSRAVKRH